MLNRRGPRMETWGTPRVSSVGSDVKLLIDTKYFLLVKYILNLFSTDPVRPIQPLRCVSHQAWRKVNCVKWFLGVWKGKKEQYGQPIRYKPIFRYHQEVQSPWYCSHLPGRLRQLPANLQTQSGQFMTSR